MEIGILLPQAGEHATRDVVLRHARAAEEAGCPKKNARIQGSKWLTNPNIKALVEKGLADLEKRSEKKQDDVRREIDNLAFMNPGDLFIQTGKKIKLKNFGKPLHGKLEKFQKLDPH